MTQTLHFTNYKKRPLRRGKWLYINSQNGHLTKSKHLITHLTYQPLSYHDHVKTICQQSRITIHKLTYCDLNVPLSLVRFSSSFVKCMTTGGAGVASETLNCSLSGIPKTVSESENVKVKWSLLWTLQDLHFALCKFINVRLQTKNLYSNILDTSTVLQKLTTLTREQCYHVVFCSL